MFMDTLSFRNCHLCFGFDNQVRSEYFVSYMCRLFFYKLPLLRKVDIFGYTLYMYVISIIRNIILLKFSHITYLQIRTQF